MSRPSAVAHKEGRLISPPQAAHMNTKPLTPVRRSLSAGPLASQRSTRRTSIAQARTPAPAQRYGNSVGRPQALTPHGKAAAREYAARRAVITPGKDRRKSGRQQRETPRETLRLLSRALAPQTQAIAATPKAAAENIAHPLLHDVDDERALPAPRLSMPLEEDGEDDSLLLPPQTHGVEDESFTAYSIEAPRRAVSELPKNRYSRGSLGSLRVSDYFPGAEAGLNGVYDAGSEVHFQSDTIDPAREPTTTIPNIGYLRRGTGASMVSEEIRPTRLTIDGEDPTFQFTIAPQDENKDSSDVGESQFRARDRHATDHVSIGNASDDDQINSIYDRSIPQDYASDEDRVRQGSPPPNLKSAPAMALEQSRRPHAARRKLRMSKHGLTYTPLPMGNVKKLATALARTGGNARSKLGKDALDAIMQASEWFFEQASDDLGIYARHAGRKTIEEDDVVALMKRQRQLGPQSTPFSLAQKHLPRELLQELRMIQQSGSKRHPRSQD